MNGPMAEMPHSFHEAAIQTAGVKLAELLSSRDAPDEQVARRKAFAIQLGIKETELDMAGTGATSGMNTVYEVRMGNLLALNAQYRGDVDWYFQNEANVEEAIEDIERSISDHPAYHEQIPRMNQVVHVLYQAARAVYSRTEPPITS